MRNIFVKTLVSSCYENLIASIIKLNEMFSPLYVCRDIYYLFTFRVIVFLIFSERK